MKWRFAKKNYKNFKTNLYYSGWYIRVIVVRLNSSLGFTTVTYRMSNGLFLCMVRVHLLSWFFLMIGVYKTFLFLFFLYRIVHFVFNFDFLPLIHICSSNREHCWKQSTLTIPLCKLSLFEDKKHLFCVTRDRC